MGEREYSTAEVAARCGVDPSLIRKWKKRGDLPGAPIGRSGAGRGNECMWSESALAEALARSNEHRSSGFRKTPHAG